MRIYTAVNVLGGGDIPCLHHLAPPFYAARLLRSPTHAAPPFIVKFGTVHEYVWGCDYSIGVYEPLKARMSLQWLATLCFVSVLLLSGSHDMHKHN